MEFIVVCGRVISVVATSSCAAWSNLNADKKCLIEILTFSSLVTGNGPRGADAFKKISILTARYSLVSSLMPNRLDTN